MSPPSAATAQRFEELAEERAALRAELDRGYLLEEPLFTPNGDVAGKRVVLNPALPALRELDRAIDALADRLGRT